MLDTFFFVQYTFLQNTSFQAMLDTSAFYFLAYFSVVLGGGYFHYIVLNVLESRNVSV